MYQSETGKVCGTARSRLVPGPHPDEVIYKSTMVSISISRGERGERGRDPNTGPAGAQGEADTSTPPLLVGPLSMPG